MNVHVNLTHGVSADEGANATGTASASIGPTGASIGASGQASATISIGETEGGNLHNGFTGSQSTTVTIGAYAQGDVEAHAGKFTGADGKSHIGVQYGANAMVGDAVTVTEAGQVQGHGVTLGGSVSVTDPGQLGVKIGGGADISHGELNLNIHGAVGVGLFGVGGGLNVGIDLKPIEAVGHTIEHGAVAVGQDIAHTAQTVGQDIEHTAQTVGSDISHAAQTAGSDISHAATTVAHALHSY